MSRNGTGPSSAKHRGPRGLLALLRGMFWHSGRPTAGYRWLSAGLATITGVAALSVAGVAYAASGAAVHEITSNWLNPPASVASGNVVTSEWHISTNDANDPQANNPVNNVRVTLVATNGVFASIPTVCKTSGVTPPSSISADGTTLVCNLGTIIEGTSTVIDAPIRAKGANGTQLSATGSVTSDSAVASVSTSAPLPGIPITTTHGMDLRLASAPATGQQGILNSAGRPTLLMGFSLVLAPGSVPGPANYSFPVTITSAAGTAGMTVDGCAPLDASAEAASQPFSDPSKSNRDSFPACSVTGSGANYMVNLTGIDYTLVNTPTLDSLGNPLPIGSYVASGTVRFSYPGPIVGASYTFTATPPNFTFSDGVVAADNNAADNSSIATITPAGGLATTWGSAGRSNWDDKLFVSPGQTDTYPATSNCIGQLCADAHSSMWATYSGPGGADMAGVCQLFSNPSIFLPKAVQPAIFNATSPAATVPVPSVHFWYSTQTFNTKTETCGEPLNSATWLPVVDPQNLPAGVTALKMTWDPAVSTQTNHLLLTFGDISPTAPVGAEDWEVVAANNPTNGVWFNASDAAASGIITPTPWSTYAPGTNGYRDVLRVVAETGTITKTTPATTATPGIPVPYTIQVSAQASSTTPPPPTTITVVDTLPAGMTYVAGSGSPAPSSVSGQTVTWVLPNSTANIQYPITYQAVLAANTGLAPGTTLTNSAEVQVPGDVRPAGARTATASVVTTSSASTQLGKSVESNTLSFYGDSSAWDLTVNSFDPVTNPFTDTIDILPASTDGRGTNIDGTYTVTGVTAPAGSTVYYSTASVASLSNDPRSASNGGTPGSVSGNTVGWTTVKPANPTAVRVIGPALAPGATQNIRIAFTTPAGTSCTAPASTDNKPGQLLVNSALSIAGHTALPMLSSATTTIGDCYALDLKKYVLAKGGNPVPADPASNPSWLDANTVAGYAQYAAGDTVPFEVIATNKGTGALTNISVSDPQAAGCGGTIASLAAGATQTFSCQLTAAAGTTVNTASASVTPPTGPALTPSDPAGFVVPDPYVVHKTSDAGSAVNPGSVVHYTITVTEPATSSAPFLNPSVSDDLSAVLDDATFNGDAAASSGSAPTLTGNTLSWSAGSIMPGQTITVTYSVTVNSPDAGDKMLTNTVVTAPGASNCPAGSADSTCTVSTPVQTYTVAKSASPAAAIQGGVVTYTVTVTNTGTAAYPASAGAASFTDALTGVLDDATYVPGSITASAGTASVTGNLVSWTGPLAVAPAAGSTVTVTYQVQVNNPDAGDKQLTNTVIPNGPGGSCTTATGCSTDTPVQTPAISLVKSASPTTVTAAGQTVTYSFLVTNTGNVALANIAVADTAFSGTGPAPAVTCPAAGASLAPGATVTCTATYQVTQADVDAGQITNTATATGTPPSGPAPVSPPSSATVTATPAPGISLVKSATPSDAASFTVGQVITYSFVATNTGNVTLSNVTINEGAFTGSGTMSAAVCPAGAASLAPGAQVTCTATYTLTQADVDAGSITNTATTTGNPPSGPPVVSPPSTVTIPAPDNPAITVVKSATPTTITAAGQTVTYSFLVTNTGNVTLTDPTVTETAFSGTGTAPVPVCPPATMLPGVSVTCTATYVATQADVDAGSITNTATSTGNPPSGPPVVSTPSSATVTATPAPGITVVKTATPSTVGKVGDTVTYSFLVTDTGNTTLTNVTVNEGAFSGTGTLSAVTCPAGPASLAPGASVTCTASYTFTQADVDAGQVTNTATATGTPPSGPPPVSPPSTTTVTATPAPGITVVKTATPSTVGKVGDTVTYSFLVTNTGNTTLTDVTVNEGAFSGTGTLSPVTCPAGAASLAPNASVTCTASYTFTQADVDAGKVTNTATATGFPPSGPPPVSPPSTTIVTVPPAPSISLVKSATPSTITAAGETASYSFLVTNTGNVTLTNPTVTETAFSGTGTAPVPVCPPATLLPGAQLTCTATYAATQADVDAGQITNTATATGTPPSGPPPVSPPSSATVTATQAPAISVVKSATPSDAASFTVGQVITYSFVATNTGNTTLTNVTIDEGAFTGSGTMSPAVCPAGAASLAPGAQVTCTATYTLTQADVDAGSITNTATTGGFPPSGPRVVSPPSKVTIPAPDNPAITVVKSATPTTITAAGQTITYSFLVTNTGNVTLSNASVTETAFSGTGTAPVISCPAGAASLAPGAQVTCTATYVATQADVDAGSITNTATATGTPPSGPAPVSPPSTATITATPAPGLTVVKSASPSDAASFTVGQVITYSFVATNTGNTTLSNVTINEGAFTGTGTLSPVTCPAGAASLAPGAQVTCTATYTVTQADVDAGSITNTATATGNPPSGPPAVSTPSKVTIPAPDDPAITVLKTASTQSVTKVGQVVGYSFLVTNTGNVTLTDAKPVEGSFTGTGQLSAITCPAGAASLVPGASVTCTASYTVTAADVSSGKKLSNTATATAIPPSGDPVVSDPSVVTVVTPTPPTPSAGALPDTGSVLSSWIIFGAPTLLLLGLAAVFIDRRRRRRV